MAIIKNRAFVVLLLGVNAYFSACSDDKNSNATDASAVKGSSGGSQITAGTSGIEQAGIDVQAGVGGQGEIIDSGAEPADGNAAGYSGQSGNQTSGSGGVVSDAGGSGGSNGDSGGDSGEGDSGAVDGTVGDSTVSDSGGDGGATDCTREMLQQTIDAYYTALAAHDSSSLSLAPNVKFTENGEQIELGAGLWQTAGNAKFKRSALDTETCISVTESVIAEASADIVLGVRLKLEQQSITEIETIVVRSGDGFSNPAALIGTESDDWETPLAVEQRPTREQLKRVVDLYFMLFPNGACHFTADCVRFENGFSPGSCTGFGIGCPDPDAVTDPSTANMVPRLYVLDVEASIAVGFVMWRGLSTDFHMFKVRDGEIRGVHATLISSNGSGWD